MNVFYIVLVPNLDFLAEYVKRSPEGSMILAECHREFERAPFEVVRSLQFDALAEPNLAVYEFSKRN